MLKIKDLCSYFTVNSHLKEDQTCMYWFSSSLQCIDGFEDNNNFIIIAKNIYGGEDNQWLLLF